MYNNTHNMHYPNTSELLSIAYHRVKVGVNKEIEKFIDGEEKKHIFKIIIGILAPTLYIMAVANDLDKMRTSILVVLAFLYGLFKVGMLSLKFFKEFIVVLVEWNKNKIQIEGKHYILIILVLLVILIVLSIILIFLYSKS